MAKLSKKNIKKLKEYFKKHGINTKPSSKESKLHRSGS